MSERCALCTGEHNCVKGTGPKCNDYTFVGEAPGLDEDKKKEPFVGKTGKEVNEGYLPLAGLSRSRVRMTNAIQCLPSTPKHKLDMKKQAHRDLLFSCAEHHLYPELEETHPSLIIPMGAFACHVIDQDIDLELQHGIPMSTSWGKVFPMYHPAGGLHEPKKMLMIRTDWVRLRKHLRGVLTLPTDAYPNPDYRECETPDELDQYLGLCAAFDCVAPMACDTETTRKHAPYCLTLSVEPGTGRLIRATSIAVLDRLQFWLDKWQGHILFHNWLFDGEVCEEMGLSFPWRRIVDTMVRVFHLGNMAQGLKSLAYRELGMVMQDFDDLVTPYSLPIVLDYYREAHHMDWPKPEEELVRTDSGGYKIYKPQGFNTKLKRFWTTYAKNSDIDCFNMWSNNWEEHQSMVEEKLGPFPGKCITHVPFEKVLFYSVRDADATLRLWPVIRHMERRVRRTSQENWRDCDGSI